MNVDVVVDGNNAKITITANTGESWGLWVYTKTLGCGTGDYGGDYPYFVIETAGIGTSTLDYNFSCKGDYIAKISAGGPDLDYALFTIAETIRYRCTGDPDYQCVIDPQGQYATLYECKAACNKVPIPPTLDQNLIWMLVILLVLYYYYIRSKK